MPLVNRSFPLLLCCALLFAGGCKRTETAQAADPLPLLRGRSRPIDPATAGSIEGTVHLIGKAPERIEIDMAQDPACAMSPYGKNLTEGIVSQKDGATTGKLANVYVYVKDGLGNKVFAAPMEPAVLDQKGCRYVPHVLAAMVGQPIEFRNSDPTMHNVHMQPTVGRQPAVRHLPAAQRGHYPKRLRQAGTDDPGALQQSSLDAGLPQRCAEPVLRGERRGWALRDPWAAPRHLHAGSGAGATGPAAGDYHGDDAWHRDYGLQLQDKVRIQRIGRRHLD